MKQHPWLLPIIVFVLSALLLDACTFSIEVITTPTFSPPTATQTSTPLTPTLLPATASLPSVTPTFISIRAEMMSMVEIFSSFGEGEPVRSLAFSPDGTVLTAAGGSSEDFAIPVWEAANGRPIGILGGHTGIVRDLAFSPDGQMLASVSSDGTAQVRDWRNRDVLKTLSFPGEVVSVRFSPDGQRLAVGGVDEARMQTAAVWIFSVDSWEPLIKIPEHVNIGALAYSPDGRLLVGGGTSRDVHVWRTSDGTSIFTLSHAHPVGDVAISPDSSTAATATCQYAVEDECTEGGVWVWNLSTGRLIVRLADFPDVVEGVAFSVDGSSLIAASRGGVLRVYTTSDYQLVFKATPPGGNGVMALAPDGGLLATGGANGRVHLWKVVYRP